MERSQSSARYIESIIQAGAVVIIIILDLECGHLKKKKKNVDI